MHSVHINGASELQLKVLLGLSDAAATAVLAKRPFQDIEGARRALPDDIAARLIGLDMPKLDINAVKPKALLAAGLSQDAAASIVAARPIHLLFELAGLQGIDAAAFALLASLFHAGGMAYTDKSTGAVVELSPRTDEVLVKLSEEEAGAGGVAPRLARSVTSEPRARGDRYAVFKASQTEAAARTLGLLQSDAAVDRALPSYRDAQGARRHLDPSYCVVQFVDGASAVAQEKLLAELKLKVEERHRTPGLLTLRLKPSAGPEGLMSKIAALNRAPIVSFAEPAYLGFDDLEAAAAPTQAAGTALPWHLDLIDAPAGWADTRGHEDVVIAVIDTGVDASHPALSAGIEPARQDDHWNFVDDDDPLPIDDQGHGTFIAGLLVGNAAAGVSGICPGCRILPLKVPLHGSVSAYARRRDAILYALDRVKPPRRLIINLSWKTAGNVAVVRDAIETASAQGALLFASAGNWPERENEPHFPSDYRSVVSVGAVGPNGNRAPYSYFGAELDLAAPGGAGNTDPANDLSSTAPGGQTATDFGTSFAAPLAAGIAALVWSRDRTLSAAQVRAIVERAARPMADAGVGAGLVTAVGPAEAPDVPPAPPGPGSIALDMINSATLEQLLSRFDLLPITARIIVARRPFNDLTELWPMLGLSQTQFERLSG